jgi:glycosyltransferase involved in cell wall biosynthesis
MRREVRRRGGTQPVAPILTIAIPTYNRATLLDKQLGWLARALDGVGDAVEVLLSDNHSDDDTPAVIERWRDRLGAARVRVHRHPENVGAIRNIAGCIESAGTEFVWTVSDDDAIDDDAVPRVLELIESHPDLAVAILNFSSRDVRTGRLLFERCFEVGEDDALLDGRELFERYLADPNPSRWGGLALTTALVYRTSLARSALASWPEGLDNLTVQLYVTAFCAAKGDVVVTEDNYLECAAGTHFFLQDRRMRLGFRYAEVAETWVKLAEIGYPSELCERKARDQVGEFHLRFVASCFVRWPVYTVQVLARYGLARRSLHRDVRRWSPPLAEVPPPPGRT